MKVTQRDRVKLITYLILLPLEVNVNKGQCLMMDWCSKQLTEFEQIL